MVITKKIEKDEKKLEEERARIIEKGGAVTKDVAKKEGKRKTVILRMSEEFLEKVDKAVAQREGVNRMAWLLQAAQEKLERDDNE